MRRIGKWMFVTGLTLGLVDMVLITLMPRNPLPPAVGLLMPCGVWLSFCASLFAQWRKNG